MLKRLFAALVLAGSFCLSVSGQHCAPITSSYLASVSMRPELNADANSQPSFLNLKLEYAKSGGRLKESYQVYVLAYHESNTLPVKLTSAKEQGSNQELFDSPIFKQEHVVVLANQIVKRAKDGTYPLTTRLNEDEIARKLAIQLTDAKQDRLLNGSWARIRGKFRVVVFIPFLEDEAYANLPGLPKDRHECNYTRDRALLWQTLPWKLGIQVTGRARQKIKSVESFDNPKLTQFRLHFTSDSNQ